MYSEFNDMHPRHPGSNKEVILFAGFHDLGAQHCKLYDCVSPFVSISIQ